MSLGKRIRLCLKDLYQQEIVDDAYEPRDRRYELDAIAALPVENDEPPAE